MAAGDYCVLQDVQNWLPSEQKVNNQTGNPIASVVSGWITDYSNAINDALKQGGAATIPVTDTSALGRLKLVLSRELAFQVMAVRATVKSEKVTPLYETWHKEYEELIKAISSGEIFAALVGNLAWSYTQDSVHDTTSSDPSIDPKISVDAVY